MLYWLLLQLLRDSFLFYLLRFIVICITIISVQLDDVIVDGEEGKEEEILDKFEKEKLDDDDEEEEEEEEVVAVFP